MATGTGKTYTPFQSIWRLWRAGVKKRILFLADRNILVDDPKDKDFIHFGDARHKISSADPSQARDHPHPKEEPKDSGAGMPDSGGKSVGATPQEGVDTTFEPEEDPEAT